MAEVLINVSHLSRREIKALRMFDARIHELRAAGETLGFYTDIIPILIGSVHQVYRNKNAARKASLRLAELFRQTERLNQPEGQA